MCNLYFPDNIFFFALCMTGDVLKNILGFCCDSWVEFPIWDLWVKYCSEEELLELWCGPYLVFSCLFFFYFVVILLKRISIHQGFVYRCVFIAFLLCLRLPWCRIPFFSGSTYDTYFESTLFSLSHDVYLCCRAEFPNNNFTHRKTCYIVAFPHGWKPTI